MPGQLTLLDAPSLWYRAFHGVPESVTAPDGTPVNLVRGTIDLIARVVKDTRPARLVACLDHDWRPAFRVAAIPSYKAHRLAENGAEAEPATLPGQVAVLLEVLDAVGVATAGVEGYEADDVLGTLSARETGAVDVVTGDRDMFQLVRDDGPVRVLYTVEKMAPYTPATVAAKYGIPGTAYAEYAVLRGDPSDGLPGVPGIGEKTAAKLITEFGSLPALLAAAEKDDSRITPRIRGKLAEAAEYLLAAPSVVRVVRDAPVTTDRADDHVPRSPADPARVTELQRRWGLGGTVDRLREALS